MCWSCNKSSFTLEIRVFAWPWILLLLHFAICLLVQLYLECPKLFSLFEYGISVFFIFLYIPCIWLHVFLFFTFSTFPFFSFFFCRLSQFQVEIYHQDLMLHHAAVCESPSADSLFFGFPFYFKFYLFFFFFERQVCLLDVVAIYVNIATYLHK